MTPTPPPGMEEYVNAPAPELHQPTPQSGTPVPPPGMAEYVREETLQREHGGAGQQLLAGLEGAARGLTLGTSDVVAPLFGFDSRSMRERREIGRAHV